MVSAAGQDLPNVGICFFEHWNGIVKMKPASFEYFQGVFDLSYCQLEVDLLISFSPEFQGIVEQGDGGPSIFIGVKYAKKRLYVGDLSSVQRHDGWKDFTIAEMPFRAVKSDHGLDRINLIGVEEGACISGFDNNRHIEEVGIVAESIVEGVVVVVDNVAWLIFQFLDAWSEGTVRLINCAVF
jgi:hypothetical protein